MESRFTVCIPLSLADKLKRVAKELRRTRSDLVRIALEKFLSVPREPLETRSCDRVRDLVGSLESGVPDLGQNHRAHLLQRLKGDA